MNSKRMVDLQPLSVFPMSKGGFIVLDKFARPVARFAEQESADDMVDVINNQYDHKRQARMDVIKCAFDALKSISAEISNLDDIEWPEEL